MSLLRANAKTEDIAKLSDTLAENFGAEMKDAARVLDFERAAELRDIILEMKAQG